MIVADGSLGESIIPRVFLAIAIVIVAARLAGMLARRLRQPPVVGEIIGGILLGPTLLGAFPGALDERFFPLDTRDFLTVIANLGLIIFMFIVGLELDTTLIKGKERIAGAISLSSIALPMTLGVLLAVYLHRAHGVVDGNEIAFLPFALFIGASMSITAFPVLARIMLDRGMYRTEVGALTLACAAIDDVLAWALLAIVLAVIETGTFFTLEFPKILGLSIAFAVVMALVVRPLLARLVPAFNRAGRLTPNLAAVVIVGFLASAFVTSEIGVHHILGAFTFGAMMPRRDAHALTLEILERLEQVTLVLLLPVFFVTTGLAVDVRALRLGDMAVLGLILLTACVGKFVGATVAARSMGIRPWRKAAAIGTLMNTRGLTELIILSVGREAGVLDDRLFTMLVVMAIVTTVVTEPALRLFYPDRLLARDVAEAQKLSLGLPDAYRVFVAVDDPAASKMAVSLACDIVGDERPAEVVLSRLVELAQTPELARGTGALLAEITASMDAMAELEEQVTASGIGARVFTRYSNEPLRDLVGQAAASDTDLVILGAAGDLDDAPQKMADELDRVVAVFAGVAAVEIEGGVIEVIASDSDNGVAALDVAARMARTRGAELRIVTGGKRARRWDAIIDRLAQAGLRAVAESSEDTSAGGRPAAPTRLIVCDGSTRSLLAGRTDASTLLVFAPPDMGRTADDVAAAMTERRGDVVA